MDPRSNTGQGGTVMLQPDELSFKDPTTLTKWTKGLLYAQIVLCVIAIVSDVMEHMLLAELQSGLSEDARAGIMERATASDTRQQIIGIAQFALFVVVAIFILRWIYRANQNARALGATAMRFTPGWAILWYFIPIANLWKPYQAMKEIWKASADPHDPGAAETSRLLPWWWFLWILSNIVGQVLVRVGLAAKEVDALIGANLLMVVSDGLDIVLDLVLLAIIDRIWRMQMSRFANRPTSGEPQTQPAPGASSV